MHLNRHVYSLGARPSHGLRLSTSQTVHFYALYFQSTGSRFSRSPK